MVAPGLLLTRSASSASSALAAWAAVVVRRPLDRPAVPVPWGAAGCRVKGMRGSLVGVFRDSSSAVVAGSVAAVGAWGAGGGVAAAWLRLIRARISCLV